MRRFADAMASAPNSSTTSFSTPADGRAFGRPSSWPPAWTPGRTGCPGPPGPRSSRSTSRRSSSSRPRRWPNWARSHSRSPDGRGRLARRLAAAPGARPASIPRSATAWIAEGLLGYLPRRRPGPAARPDHRPQRAGSRFATEGLVGHRRCRHEGDAPPHAAPIRSLARARLRSRHGRAGLFRRPNGVATYLAGPRLGHRRQQRRRPFRRTWPAADR